jgi:HAD superfamily hydrolase (TIGR01509 family)
MGVSAVIFDMDGLMFDTERVARSAWERAMADWGYVIPDALYLTVVGRTAQSAQAIFQQAWGPHLPIEAIYYRKEQYLEDTLTQDGLPFKPGLVELLEQLERWRIPKAVASSTARNVVLRRLTRAEVTQRFAAIVGGDDVTRSKPAPDLFLAAARQLHVPAEECVVLEDADAGVQAASAAGMTSVMVPDLKPPAAESRRLAYRIVSSLREVQAVLAALRGVAG